MALPLNFNHRLNLVLEIEKRFSKLFSPEWEGKIILRTLQSRMGRRNNFPSVQALGIRKCFWISFWIMEVFSQNSHLMYLLKELFSSKNLGLKKKHWLWEFKTEKEILHLKLENQHALFHIILMPSRWLHDDASELFINVSSQNFLTNNHKQILNPRHYNNVQEVQVQRQIQKQLNYSRIMGHFKQALNYSLDDDDEKNLDDMILSYIVKKIEEHESRCQTATEKSQSSNNAVKLHDGLHNKVGSISNSQQVNLNSGEKENEVSECRCDLCHKTKHYTPKCPNKENA
ncbi:hypothetical protein C1645_838258 [Glomus cerebriforme]|uniref:Uncharacterized protein n=1 Tax=Glomus cerebriforme TaxID=658196 RepID=A0A397SD82_9GLOM|nr:hypothetical protein C1645_838258 [Glomus cerebriforme]